MSELLGLGLAILVLVVVLLVVENMVGALGTAVDAIRGRDHCHFCGAELTTSADGVRRATRCRRCERSQPWGHAA